MGKVRARTAVPEKKGPRAGRYIGFRCPALPMKLGRRSPTEKTIRAENGETVKEKGKGNQKSKENRVA